MREKKECGESSPLSSIEDIQKRLVRPSQDSSFRYSIADPKRRDDQKTCESLTMKQDSGCAKNEFAHRKAEDLKCLEKRSKVYPKPGDQIADLKYHENRKRSLKSPTIDDLIVDDSALLTADFVDESFKEHQLFLDCVSVSWESDYLISGSKPQEDPDEWTMRTITRNNGRLVSDVESGKDVKRMESRKAKFGRFDDLMPDSELDPHEEPKLLEQLLYSPQFSDYSIADLKIKKLLKNSEETPLILQQVGDPGPRQHLKHLEEDGPNQQIVGDFVSRPDAVEEGGKPDNRKEKAIRGKEEMARLEDYLHPSLLSAAASKMRKRMKKAIFEWPTEELRTLANSGCPDRAVGDQRARAGSDYTAFGRYHGGVFKLFHA